ncbi:MAG: insulinase family protein [Sphingomonadales bacterium]|nr:insulinase family protein [Sphingomonadales bacterium]
MVLIFWLAACAATPAHPAAAPAARAAPAWAFSASDVAVDPAYRFGRLPNGMRYVIRRNANPAGQALVRMEVATGSLDEREAERGYAHFVEHLAFQGSSHVPEGEMVRLLERQGLAFGADTNAATSFEQTTYMLDLPRSDPALINTALMLLRETASALSFLPDAVARERGVVLAEMRDRNSWQYRETLNRQGFMNPHARYVARMPIGTAATLAAATPATLRAFWSAHYVPQNTTLIVIGDVDPAAVETTIRARFASWMAAPAPVQPRAGPIEPHDRNRATAYLDPAAPDRLFISRHGAWLDEPDTIAHRREEVLRRIGYAIIERRLDHLARRADPPFRDAGFGTVQDFQSGRTTNLVVDCISGQWQRGMAAAAGVLHRALTQGFTASEVAEQVANIRETAEHGAAAADTRSDGELLNAVFALLRSGTVPTTPQSALARLDIVLPQASPANVLAALKREAVPLDRPLILYQGRLAPTGGLVALRRTWRSAWHARPAGDAAPAPTRFAYTDFGTPGAVVADRREPRLGIREIRFANGLRLNLKHTDIDHDRVLVQMRLDGGDLLDTRADPLATTLTDWIAAGGLGRHSADELQTLLAGHRVGGGLQSGPEGFVANAETTPADLDLQLALMTAYLTDPGFRREGEVEYRLAINNWLAGLDATPQNALDAHIGALLSDNDPRFTLQKPEFYRNLSFARLRQAIADRLAHGAIEIGLVGDIDEDAAIALVARTLGALPAREPDFRPYADQRQRVFTTDHTPRIVHHSGPADQALLELTWLTRDDSDPVAKQVLNLLQRVVQIELTECLRQRLGKAYSPGAVSAPSRVWTGYGTFAITAAVDTADLAATRAAIAETLAELRDHPISDDLLLRARAPLIESFDNALKSNGGWLMLVATAQSNPERIDRQLQAVDRLRAVTPADIQAAARRYLTTAGAVEVTALPGPDDSSRPIGGAATIAAAR